MAPSRVRTVLPTLLALLVSLLAPLPPLLDTAEAQKKPAPKTVAVHVKVIDKNAKPVEGARVRGIHDKFGPELREFDYEAFTNKEGIATLQVIPGRFTGESMLGTTLEVEVYREPFRTTYDRFSISGRIPEVNRTVLLLSTEESRDPKSGIPVQVHVEDEGGKPLPGARVRVAVQEGPEEGYTNENGDVLIEVSVPQPTSAGVEAFKDGYKPKGKAGGKTLQLKPKDRGRVIGPVELTLERTEEAKHQKSLSIIVTEEVSNAPVKSATVVLDAGGKKYYSGTTNDAGRLSLSVPETGRFEVRIDQRFYEPVRTNVRLDPGDRELSFSMKPKPKPLDSTLEVQVFAADMKDARGRVQPLKDATVTMGAGTTQADEQGKASVSFWGGAADLVEVTVKAPGYKTQTRSVDWTHGAKRRSVRVVLEPEPETKPIQLVVEVKDVDTGDPVSGALVSIKLPNGLEYASTRSDAKGEAPFTITAQPKAPLAELRKGLVADVIHPDESAGYEKATQAISPDLLQPSTEPRRFLVQLKSQKADTELQALEGGVADLERMKGELLGYVKAAETHAGEAAQAEAAARGQLQALSRHRAALRKNAKACEAVAQELPKSKQAVTDADRLGTELALLADEAAGMACPKDKPPASQASPDPAGAQKKLEQAKEKLAGIDTLLASAKKTADVLAQMRQVDPSVIPADQRPEDLQKAIADVAAKAKDAAAKADSKNAEADTVLRVLTSERDKLQQRLNAFVATHGKRISGERKKRADGVRARLKALNPGAIKVANLAAEARKNATAAEGHVKEAENILALGKSATCDETVKAQTEAISQIESSATAAKLAFDQRASRVDECVKKGGCEVALAEIEQFLQQARADEARSRIEKARQQGCDANRLNTLASREACLTELAPVDGLLQIGDVETARPHIDRAAARGCDVVAIDDRYWRVQAQVWPLLSQARATVDAATGTCNFKESYEKALALQQAFPQHPWIVQNLQSLAVGWNAQQTVTQELDQAVVATRAGDFNTADAHIARAEQAAQPFPCMVATVQSFRVEYAKAPRPQQTYPVPQQTYP
ncbi:MAG: hypothetical protein WBV82_05555, partial [Myxococcaceae bacterium]